MKFLEWFADHFLITGENNPFLGIFNGLLIMFYFTLIGLAIYKILDFVVTFVIKLF